MIKQLMRLALLALIMFSGASIASAGDWTGFRGTGGTATSQESSLPIQWAADENVRWKAELPGRGLSNPVIAEGKIYVTASSGNKDRRLHVLCFDEKTGKKLWERQFEATGSTACHPKSCMAAPTPVTDGKYVYALFATGDIAALNVKGELLWYRSLVSDYPTITNQVGMAASPVLADGALIVPMENAGDSFVAGLDLKTGKNLWKLERDRDINWTTPLVMGKGDKATVVFQGAKGVTALDPLSGKSRWNVEMDKSSTIPSPIAGGDMIFAPGTELLALKPGPDDTTPQVVWRSNRLTSSFASPVYYKGRIYGLTNTGINCVDAADGKFIWQQRVAGPFSASPIVADGKMYVTNEDGDVTVIELADKPKVLAVNRVDDTLLATPAIANGAIFLRSDKYLYCIGSKK